MCVSVFVFCYDDDDVDDVVIVVKVNKIRAVDYVMVDCSLLF